MLDNKTYHSPQGWHWFNLELSKIIRPRYTSYFCKLESNELKEHIWGISKTGAFSSKFCKPMQSALECPNRGSDLNHRRRHHNFSHMQTKECIHVTVNQDIILQERYPKAGPSRYHESKTQPADSLEQWGRKRVNITVHVVKLCGLHLESTSSHSAEGP